MQDTFEAKIERVAKLPNPLLVVGLGGTGAAGVKQIKKLFHERFELPRDDRGREENDPQNTAYLVIDSDTKSGLGLMNGEFLDISVRGMARILDPSQREHNLNPNERSWIHKDLSAVSEGLGGGTIRQATRLMLFRRVADVLKSMTLKLSNLSGINRGEAETANPPRIEVVIVTGICGGTGSGIFLDIGYLIRYLCGKVLDKAYQITTYIIMPDISLEVTDDNSLRNIFRANAFSALKELDYWMRVDEHKSPYSVKYSQTLEVIWNDKPFDQCVLLSGTTMMGHTFDNPMEVALETMAENLLHYLADERSDDAGDYTFIQHEDNIRNARGALSKEKPLCYTYRAIGAYSKSLPKESTILLEGKLLLQTFMPEMDLHQRLVINRAQLTDGLMQTRAKEMTDDMQVMYRNYCPGVKLPDFCDNSPTDKDRMQQLRTMNPPPFEHARAGQSWATKIGDPKARESAEVYAEKIWGRFETYAKGVINEKSQGPYSLLHYLTDAEGLIENLETEQRGWDALARNFQNSVTQKHGSVSGDIWKKFRNPPLIEIKLPNQPSIAESFLRALRDYYDAVRRFAFVSAYAETLADVIARIRDYVDKSLQPMCDTLRSLATRFGRVEEMDIDNDEIIPFSQMRPLLEDIFETANRGDAITSVLLQKLGDLSLEYVPDVTMTSKVRWEMTPDALAQAIKDALFVNFASVNGQSADAIMVQTIGTDLGAQNRYLDRLANNLVINAVPLFLQDSAMASEDAIRYSYLSMPADSPRHIQRFQISLSGNQGRHVSKPKASSISDHIYCLNSDDGLPLYRYGKLGELESCYEMMGPNRMGGHLVQDGLGGDSVLSDWSHLPSPRPYYLFSFTGGSFATREYARVRGLVERAIDCGMIAVDAEQRDKVGYSVRVLYTDGTKRTARSSADIQQRVMTIVGGSASAAEKRSELEALWLSSSPQNNTCTGNTERFATNLGLNDEPCNPWDPQIEADPIRLEIAWENRRKLAREHAICCLSMLPYLMDTIALQIDGMEAIRKARESIEQEDNRWQLYHAKTKDIVDMLLYGLVTPTMAGYTFAQYDGSIRQLYDMGEVPDNLRSLPQLVLLVRHITELTENSPIVKLLVSRLNEARAPQAQAAIEMKELDRLLKQAQIQLKSVNGFIQQIDFNPPNDVLGDDLTNARAMLTSAQNHIQQFINQGEVVLSSRVEE